MTVRSVAVRRTLRFRTALFNRKPKACAFGFGAGHYAHASGLRLNDLAQSAWHGPGASDMPSAPSRFIPNPTPCGRSRREFLWQAGGGFAGLALIDLLARDGFFGNV